ncbi:mechanosensitive ion channel family protein [Xanthomonadaceae bacterium JHOS43]|nr:mechanosensitive ion channel family protein [Xanthomonadaceae bacterium JHOS43]MCX7564549.1 mechanosensitive ion channel family protein [Xanthomonadaceae bacterium XH05]
MMAWIQSLREMLEPHPGLYAALVVCALCVAAWLANFVTKKVLLRALRRALRATVMPAVAGDGRDFRFGVIPRLANIVPALVLMAGVALVPGLPDVVVKVVRNVGAAFIALTVAMAVSKALDMVDALYGRRKNARSKPIKGYLQLVKIVVFAVAAVLMIAALIDRSPLVLLSGLGAMMAVLILVFQDTLLSIVAGVTVSSNDMIRVGDWIEMPSANADGDVVDISLHTIKVQNWDKTVTAVPIKRFLSESFKNWRGMSESGGRRIKRALHLDQSSVRFLDAAEQQRLHRLRLIDDYLDGKEDEIAQWNAQQREWVERDTANARRLTNVGTFRAYVMRYLRAHPGIHQDMTLLVRQLQPGATGLPLEIYCFTSDTRWGVYEDIQSDIFDHLLAILPEFGLRVFQEPTGYDLRDGLSATRTLPSDETTVAME